MFDICYLDPHTVPLFKMPEIKLTYFNIEGKAELIRLLLHAGNFNFEDFRVSSSKGSSFTYLAWILMLSR